MAQVFGDQDMKGEEQQIHDDPLHDVKGQIESGVGTISSQPLFDGASGGEKLPETRVGETLLTDNVQKLDSTEAASMDTDESAPEDRVVKSDVAETFADEYKEGHDGSDDKKESVSDDGDNVKSGFSGDDSQGTQEQEGTKFKKLTGAGIPRGKPHFRVSSTHGNRGLGDSSVQSGGLGGGPGGSAPRGSSRGGLARTGSGLARTGSGIPQGNNEMKDFSAALLESDSKSSESSLPTSTNAKLVSDDKESDSSVSEKAIGATDAAADKFNTAREATGEKLSIARDDTADKLNGAREAAGEKLSIARDAITEKATTAKNVIVEKAGDLKTGLVATLKDQLIPVKDSDVKTSDMEVDESALTK